MVESYPGQGAGPFRRTLFLFLACCTVVSAYAGGAKDTEEKTAKTVDSWSESLDITDKKPGKYNVLITGTDLAGNHGFAGPINIFIDPVSDLPVTGITNPLRDMRVPGNLNVVGTCIDDDAVDHVEILFDSSDDPIRAQGKEFWSYYLDAYGLDEGLHTITVYGVDVNGTKGKPVSVMWNLDRNQPETTIDAPSMGTLVSGIFTPTGKAYDGNGIKQLSYSIDNGKTYEDIKLVFDARDAQWRFTLPLDSKKLRDGPGVCWFRSTDGQGSIGLYTFLFIVDNTKPETGIIYPAEGEAVNGIFSVAGYARDAVGIASLSWRVGKESGDFELVKGNPYWVHEFNATEFSGKTFDVEIIATDIAGNRVSVTKKIPVDPIADKPVVSVTISSSGSLIDGDVQMSGYSFDDDAVGSVCYSLDKGPQAATPAEGSFDLLLPAPAMSGMMPKWFFQSG